MSLLVNHRVFLASVGSLLSSALTPAPHAQAAPAGTQEFVYFEQIDERNDPTGIPSSGEFERKPGALPREGVSRPVWSGSWWPVSERGIAARLHPGEASPAEKFDAAVGGNATTAHELQDWREQGDISWAGHCNGLAAAGIWTKEPKRSVSYRGQNFRPDDVKALLVEAYQGGGTIVGGRCELAVLARGPFGRILEPACRDLSPATLHLALTNFIGLRKFPVVLDVATNVEVWNYPVTAYAFRSAPLAQSQATQLTTGTAGAYPFNAKAKKFLQVQLGIKLANNEQRNYDYVLEGDESGEIIGGEWLPSTQGKQPDFIWLPEVQPEPVNPGIRDHLDAVKEIYRLATE